MSWKSGSLSGWFFVFLAASVGLIIPGSKDGGYDHFGRENNDKP